MTAVIQPPRPLAALAAVSAALLVLCLIWAAFDPRLIDGSASWAKPLKFAISFVVFFGTMALAAQFFSPAWRQGKVLWSIAALTGAAMSFEMVYMIFQASQGQASHFNASSAFTEIMYGLMGIGAVTLVVAAGVMGWAAMRDVDGSFGPALRFGVGWGFIGSCVLTLITAGTMSSMSGHFIGIPGPDAATFPLMGWSAAVGDLRPAHFVALHMMQALPLLGLWVDRQGGSLRTMRVAAVVYAAVTMGLFAQALLGMPVIRL